MANWILRLRCSLFHEPGFWTTYEHDYREPRSPYRDCPMLMTGEDHEWSRHTETRQYRVCRTCGMRFDRLVCHGGLPTAAEKAEPVSSEF